MCSRCGRSLAFGQKGCAKCGAPMCARCLRDDVTWKRPFLCDRCLESPDRKSLPDPPPPTSADTEVNVEQEKQEAEDRDEEWRFGPITDKMFTRVKDYYHQCCGPGLVFDLVEEFAEIRCLIKKNGIVVAVITADEIIGNFGGH